MARKKQGYNARLDERLGEVGTFHRGSYSQSLKDRRDESKGENKSLGKRPYSSVSTMDRPLTASEKKKAGEVLAKLKREIKENKEKYPEITRQFFEEEAFAYAKGGRLSESGDIYWSKEFSGGGKTLRIQLVTRRG